MGQCCHGLFYRFVKKKSSYKKEAELEKKGAATQQGGEDEWGGWDEDLEVASPSALSKKKLINGISESASPIPDDSHRSAATTADVKFYKQRSPRGGEIRKAKAGWIVRDKSKAKKMQQRPLLSTTSSFATSSQNNDPFKSMGMDVADYSGDRKIQVKRKTSALLNARNNSSLRSKEFSLEDDVGEDGWDLEDDDI